MTYSPVSGRISKSCVAYYIAAFILLTAVCGFASADVSKGKVAPCKLIGQEADGLNGDAGTDVHAVDNYVEVINGLLRAGKFGQIDCIAASVRTAKEMFPGGMWKIHAVYAGIARPPLHPTQEDWRRHIALLDRWVALRPSSITARIGLAESEINFGIDARGTGTADTVSTSGWKLFSQRTAKAKQILDQAFTLSTKDPEWYAAMQSVALNEQWDRSARQALLDKAVKFEPAYYYYYRMYATSILPKWGGEEAEVAAFMKESADKIGGDEGDILYFQVAGNIVCGCQTDQQLNLSWPKIMRGFDALEKRSGSAPENWNILAMMAMSFRDPAVAAKMFTRIGDQWAAHIWGDISDFESAKKFAEQMGPVIQRKTAAERPAAANLATTEGQSYNVAFADKIQAWMQPCLQELAGADLGNFELLIKVGKQGTIDEITGGGNSPVMSCLGNKINEFRMSKQVVFPPPPQPDYWVRYDFNPSNGATAALK